MDTLFTEINNRFSNFIINKFSHYRYEITIEIGRDIFVYDIAFFIFGGSVRKIVNGRFIYARLYSDITALVEDTINNLPIKEETDVYL